MLKLLQQVLLLINCSPINLNDSFSEDIIQTSLKLSVCCRLIFEQLQFWCTLLLPPAGFHLQIRVCSSNQVMFVMRLSEFYNLLYAGQDASWFLMFWYVLIHLLFCIVWPSTPLSFIFRIFYYSEIKLLLFSQYFTLTWDLDSYLFRPS